MNFNLQDMPSPDDMEGFKSYFPDLDADTVFLCLRFIRMAVDLMSAAEKHFANYGISPGRFTVMMLLFRYRRKGGLTPSELADKAGVTRGTITGLIDGLENSGLVERIQGDFSDRRKILISLTADGLDFLEKLFPVHFRKFQKIGSALTAEDKADMKRCLDRLSEGIAFFAESV